MDGDLVLMVEYGQKCVGYVGVYFYLVYEGWVLYFNEKNGCSVLYCVCDLLEFGLRIEGYYRWV